MMADRRIVALMLLQRTFLKMDSLLSLCHKIYGFIVPANYCIKSFSSLPTSVTREKICVICGIFIAEKCAEAEDYCIHAGNVLV